MPYPQIVEYHEAVQHPSQAFIDPELKQGAVAENNLGLPLVMSGGFALTYAVTTPRRKCAVRCFHREIPAIQQKYDAISRKLRSLTDGCFVYFDFQQSGINVRQQTFPIVRMDWVEGDTLGIWLDKHFDDPRVLEKARTDFAAIARFLEQKGIAHGDIQNGNVMVANGDIKLIDYDGMFVPGMRPGNGSETGHKHFQHPERRVSDFGPRMDRFSFIALDLSLKALVEDKSLYAKFREGGETVVFKANDFADPGNSEIFRRLLAMPKLKEPPSAAWIGRWVSVTGLMDVPYENKRYGHKHLSITVQEDGQIQQLSETEAGSRLASISTAPLPRDRGLAQGAASPNTATTVAAAAAAKPKRPRSRRSSTAARSHKPAGRRPPALAATTGQQGTQ